MLWKLGAEARSCSEDVYALDLETIWHLGTFQANEQ